MRRRPRRGSGRALQVTAIARRRRRACRGPHGESPEAPPQALVHGAAIPRFPSLLRDFRVYFAISESISRFVRHTRREAV